MHSGYCSWMCIEYLEVNAAANAGCKIVVPLVFERSASIGEWRRQTKGNFNLCYNLYRDCLSQCTSVCTATEVGVTYSMNKNCFDCYIIRMSMTSIVTEDFCEDESAAANGIVSTAINNDSGGSGLSREGPALAGTNSEGDPTRPMDSMLHQSPNSSSDDEKLAERRRVNSRPVKSYGATKGVVDIGITPASLSHLFVSSIAIDDLKVQCGRRERRVTVHSCSAEVQALWWDITDDNAKVRRLGLRGGGYHSCDDTDRAVDVHPSTLSWHDLVHLNHAAVHSSRLGQGSHETALNTVSMSWLPWISRTGLGSTSSCRSFGLTGSVDSLWKSSQHFDERSAQSDPATGSKDDTEFDLAKSNRVGTLPTFIFDRDLRNENDLCLNRRHAKPLIGSSYRGLVSKHSWDQSSDDPDKDKVETGSISTMQTVQCDLVDETPAWRIAVEIIVPFLLSGLGMIGAGLLLNIVQVKK